MDFQHLLDAEGLYCPEPVMMLHAKVADMQANEIVKVVASDPSTQRDIPKFCQFLGHTLLESCEQEQRFIFFIRKNG